VWARESARSTPQVMGLKLIHSETVVPRNRGISLTALHVTNHSSDQPKTSLRLEMRMPPRMAAARCPVMTTSSGARLAEPAAVVADRDDGSLS
jgi:hypothetical protein